MSKKIIIIGAGPAGLTAAYLLGQSQHSIDVFEADPKYVGGISKTVQHKGFSFDIGGHRFFSKSQAVEDFWTEIMGDKMLDRPRSSRILYRGKFFSYPLKAIEALFRLGVIESCLCVLSYMKAKLLPFANPKYFDQWVTNQFGKRLFNIFFKTYTEKVWGIPCHKISADWAAQRIKGLSLGSAVWNAIIPRRKSAPRANVIKTLIDSFRYPSKGPGQLWEICAEKAASMGVRIHMGYKVTGLILDRAQGLWTVTAENSKGEKKSITAEHVISSAPIQEIVPAIQPRFKSEAHALQLGYRDFITVALMVKEKNIFDDNWIYIHEPHVKVGRIQNFKSWSPHMVPDPALNCYGLEYFCFKGDELWSLSDAELLKLAKSEITKLRLADEIDILDGYVVRQEKAYPVYDEFYQERVLALRKEIEEHYPNLHLVGRNGMHKYNNQDHAMMTSMLTVKNINAGKPIYDVWRVNQDAEYHEEGSVQT